MVPVIPKGTQKPSLRAEGNVVSSGGVHQPTILLFLYYKIWHGSHCVRPSTVSLRTSSCSVTAEPQPPTQWTRLLWLVGAEDTRATEFQTVSVRCTLSTWILRAEYGDGEADLLGPEVADPRAWEKKRMRQKETTCKTLGTPVLHRQDGCDIDPPSESSVEN